MAAAQQHVDPFLIQRAQFDLAVALADLGQMEYARTVCEIIRAAPDTPGGADLKAHAGINLLRFAHRGGDRPVFDQLRTTLATEPMPGRLRAYYHLTVGHGLHRFGDVDGAKAAYLRTMEVAQQFRVHHLVMTVDEFLQAASDEPRAKPRTAPPPARSKALARILGTIDAREGPFAGVAQAATTPASDATAEVPESDSETR